MNPNQVDGVLKALEPAVMKLHEIGYKQPRGILRGIYTEFYVAREVIVGGIDKSPQVGSEREVKDSDIYLPSLKKSIEVKTTNPDFAGDARFAWSLSENEGSNPIPFDYIVLVGYDDQTALSREKVFVATKADLTTKIGVNDFRHKGYDSGYGIDYYTDESLAEEPQDRELSLHPERYENRWDKIR